MFDSELGIYVGRFFLAPGLVGLLDRFLADRGKLREFRTREEVAREQADAGAHYLDANAGIFQEHEPAKLSWIVETIQKTVDRPCCLDSPNPRALKAALKVHRGRAMVNSISLEKERFHSLLPLIKDYSPKVVALCLSEEGMPKDAEDRYRLASMLVEKLLAAGLSPDDIYVDPLIQPLATDFCQGLIALGAIEKIKNSFPEAHVVCGLSNISFGLPQRKLLNQIFLVLALSKGLDAVILNPNDSRLISCLKAAQVMLGMDEYCSQYLQAYRQGRLNF
jgi:5-methyltetrahydrofolate--homocysteine methyltransferase